MSKPIDENSIFMAGALMGVLSKDKKVKFLPNVDNLSQFYVTVERVPGTEQEEDNGSDS